MKTLVSFFVTRHYLCNFIFIGVLLCGLIAFKNIRKEELPEFESSIFRITAPLAGAMAQDVEELVTIPIEKEIQGISGIEEIESTSSVGVAVFRVELDSNLGDLRETIQEIKDATERADIPNDTREDLNFRQFRTSEKAILDLAVFAANEDPVLNHRKELQAFALSIEDRLLQLPEISQVSKSGFLKREIQILLDPQKLKQYFMPIQRVINTLENAHIVAPSGPLKDDNETPVTVIARNESVEDIENLIVRSNDTARAIRIKDIAEVREGFARQSNILRVNGRNAIVFNVRKSSSADIIQAHAAVVKELEAVRPAAEGRYEILMMDDESYDVRNRLNLVLQNGLLGFVLILSVLFAFLSFKTGFWTAMGIPFCLAFTIIVAWLIGYTLNNVTLAAIIIVLGIVVDDAIIVSEHIARLKREGMNKIDAAVKGTCDMLLPVLASILTTCVAFIPFFFFSGRMANFVKFMPALIFAMLLASLFESLFVLPSHLTIGKKEAKERSWFDGVEKKIDKVLQWALHRRFLVVSGFFIVLIGTLMAGASQLRFVLFPREEASELFVELVAKEAITKEQMGELVSPIEKLLLEEGKNDIVGIRTMIAMTRWGAVAKENRAFLRIELKDREERELSARELSTKWEKLIEPFEGFEKKGFIRHRFGSRSGSPVVIEVRESNDERRAALNTRLKETLESIEGVSNVEIDEPLSKASLKLKVKQEQAVLSNVSPNQIGAAARTFLEGRVVYDFVQDDEEVDVVLSMEEDAKNSISQLSNLFVENQQENLLRFSRLLEFAEVNEASSIQRVDGKRSSRVLANFEEGAEITPLGLAEVLETEKYPQILKDFPSSVLRFRGEIESSRKSGSELRNASLLVLFLIFGILLLLYNQPGLPVLIMMVIPFGLGGVILSLFAHGNFEYGFFTVVGTLGMIGVVVNDSIVLLSRLEKKRKGSKKLALKAVAEGAASRARAVLLTTLTTVSGLLPTAYGVFGFDSMLSEMMLAMAWGLVFGTVITLVFVPCFYSCFFLEKDSMKTATVKTL